jgi:hypothetical protein
MPTPHSVLRSSVCFASKLMDLSCWDSFPHRPVDPVSVEQPQGHIQRLPTPPRPAEALAIPGTHHMAPDLLFYPVLNEREALARVPDREVINPPAQYRIDQLHDPIYWLRLVASEHCFEFPQQRRSFLEFRRHSRCTSKRATTGGRTGSMYTTG